MAAKRFTVEFGCENDWFEEGDLGYQIAEILRSVVERLDASEPLSGRVFDPNGNTIGRYAYSDEGDALEVCLACGTELVCPACREADRQHAEGPPDTD